MSQLKRNIFNIILKSHNNYVWNRFERKVIQNSHKKREIKCKSNKIKVKTKLFGFRRRKSCETHRISGGSAQLNDPIPDSSDKIFGI